jgi:MoaA/NifB/PqqE/SkfB family radical SAM enzyme
MRDSKKCIYVDGGRTVSANGSIKPCCQIPSGMAMVHVGEDYENHVWTKLLKDNLDKGIEDKRCETCWTKEKAGLTSYRLNGWNKYKKGQITTDPYSFLDLKLGNKCNLMCRMCDPGSSSLIEKELINNKHLNWPSSKNLKGPLSSLKYKDNSWYKDPAFYEDIKAHADQVRTLKFTGGEPTLIKPVHDLIEWFAKTGHAKHTVIIITTNNTNKRLKLYDDMLNFKQAILNISVDGTEDVYNYIRYPHTWDKFLTNIEKLKPYRDKIDIQLKNTISILNAKNLVEWENWAIEDGWWHNIEIAYRPWYYNPLNLPEKILEDIKEYLATGKGHCSKQLLKQIKYEPRTQSGQNYTFKEQDPEAWQNEMMNQLVTDTQIKDTLRNQNGQFIFDDLGIQYNKA